MLPPEAKTYFEALSSSASADAWTNLDKAQRAFELAEFARGRRSAGAGFAARLAVLYEESLADRARAIANALETVHRSFHSPIGDGVYGQLSDWGTHALAAARQGLEGAYARHLEHFSVHAKQEVDLEHTYALAQATVTNLTSRYFWELRNVPTKCPQPPASALPSQLIIYNTGTLGSLQTGAGSIAHVQQSWNEGATSELLAALTTLRDRLERAQDVEPDIRAELIADVDNASVELQRETPNMAKVLRWLGGIGAVVGTVGSIQPAYEAVKDLARAFGLSI